MAMEEEMSNAQARLKMQENNMLKMLESRQME